MNNKEKKKNRSWHNQTSQTEWLIAQIKEQLLKTLFQDKRKQERSFIITTIYKTRSVGSGKSSYRKERKLQSPQSCPCAVKPWCGLIWMTIALWAKPSAAPPERIKNCYWMRFEVAMMLTWVKGPSFGPAALGIQKSHLLYKEEARPWREARREMKWQSRLSINPSTPLILVPLPFSPQ